MNKIAFATAGALITVGALLAIPYAALGYPPNVVAIPVSETRGPEWSNSADIAEISGGQVTTVPYPGPPSWLDTDIDVIVEPQEIAALSDPDTVTNLKATEVDSPLGDGDGPIAPQDDDGKTDTSEDNTTGENNVAGSDTVEPGMSADEGGSDPLTRPDTHTNAPGDNDCPKDADTRDYDHPDDVLAHCISEPIPFVTTSVLRGGTINAGYSGDTHTVEEVTVYTDLANRADLAEHFSDYTLPIVAHIWDGTSWQWVASSDLTWTHSAQVTIPAGTYYTISLAPGGSLTPRDMHTPGTHPGNAIISVSAASVASVA